MKSSFKVVLFLSLTAFSCSTNRKKQASNSVTKILAGDTARVSDTARIQKTAETATVDFDTLTIDKKAAVFYQPDSLQIEERMKEVGEASFRAGADDYIYYVNTSAEYLEKEGLPVLDAKGREYLKFVQANQRVQVIKLDTLQELWGMYFFDPNKKAYSVDITVIEDEYKTYYK